MKSFIMNHKLGISLLIASCIVSVIIRLTGGCRIYRIFHIECLSCGMFHACLAALRLDFNRAFHLHPMFWSVPIIALYIVFEGRLFKKKFVNMAIIVIIAIGFVVQYILKCKGIIVS